MLDQGRSLELLTRAHQALAEARTVDDLRSIREQAEAVRYAMDVRGYLTSAINDAVDIKLRAERRLGQLLEGEEKAVGGRPAKTCHSQGQVSESYTSRGIRRQDAARWQQVAAIPEPDFEAYVLRTKRDGDKLSTAGVLRAAKATRNAERNATTASTDKRVLEDLGILVERGEKFGTIYADPPWRYGNQATRAATDNHYPTMTVEEISALPVRELVADDAHCHLWTTNAFLFDVPRIFEAWGFTYKSVFVWVKPEMGIGNYWRVSHEFLVFGVRGRAPFADRGLKSWASFSRGEHSAKPEAVRGFIERASPAPRLELFGRRLAPGWTIWGNQVTRNIFDHDAREVVNG